MIEVKKFEADYCQPCKMLRPTFQQLENKYRGKARFSYIDVDMNESMAQKYSVRSVPFVVFEKNGQVVNKLVGVNSEKTYSDIIDNLI